MTRQEAYQILTKYLTNKNLIKHCLATEATMKALYKRLTPKDAYDPSVEEKWGITGLLHDADYELAKGQPEVHGLLLFDPNLAGAKPLENPIEEDIAYAIRAHNYQNTKVMPKSPMDWAITSCDQLTGLIVAAALVHPDKKLASISLEFILNKFNEKSFAKGADRGSILLCSEKLGMSLSEFIEITLKAMQSISGDLAL